MSAPALRHSHATRVRHHAIPAHAAARPATTSLAWRAVVSVVFWLSVLAYVIVFSALSIRQYNAFVPHALDLGNMAQAFWNTVHGNLFRFQNMRQNASIEAFGTSTRLSFHVEPVIPFLAIFYFFYQHVETLLVLQVVGMASGAIPARLLARRRLGQPFAEIVFPIAYLLFPALEAANLYEFHPVAFAAPLLLWAFYFADSERYTLFVLSAFLAMGCKEELGVLVAIIGFWIAVEKREVRFGAIIAFMGVAWSYLALKVVVPHFNLGDSSYWGRYVPRGYLGAQVVTQSDAIHFWLNHPGLVWDNLTSDAKLSYLHRLLYPAGYLSLLNPLTLLVGLPSLALIMLSYEPHMYGGVAHYSAELVPVVIVSAILGVEWLARTLSSRMRVPVVTTIVTCCAYVLIASLLNHRANGFSPLAANYSYPPITAHDRVVERALAMIPADASVSAQDNLNAHLSDRDQVYLYPDLDFNRVQYIALDATQPTGSVIRPCDLSVAVTGVNAACDVAAGPGTPHPTIHQNAVDRRALLLNGKWTIVFAEDGVLLLARHQKGEPLQTTLPPQFYTFMNPPAADVPPGGPIARLGDYLELEGFKINRTELVNLRNPDVVVTTWWRVLKPLPSRARLMHYLTDSTGALQVFWDDQQATDWSVLGAWQQGRVYKVTSYQLTVTTDHSGPIDVDVALSLDDIDYINIEHNVPVHMLRHVGAARAVGPHGTVLKLGSVRANL